MKIYIKYMVSLRCKMVVKSALEELELEHSVINLGEVDVISVITPEKRARLRGSVVGNLGQVKSIGMAKKESFLLNNVSK